MTEPDKGSYPSTYTLSSGEAAKAELRELREVAEGMAEALSEIRDTGFRAEPLPFRTWAQEKARNALARYEALRDGSDAE